MPAITDEMRCSQKTVRRWLPRFNRSGWRAWRIWAGNASAGSPRPNVPGSSRWSSRSRPGRAPTSFASSRSSTTAPACGSIPSTDTSPRSKPEP
ncbi:helix-turn-helix domain-containing protein [Streptomyces sp. NPDC001292]|uniref:helix-turn-helix domain-containing protein n=1 Tax=Streptomyces sp. NPDC001292 TaxID=3364558 RepID=UPI003699603F